MTRELIERLPTQEVIMVFGVAGTTVEADQTIAHEPGCDRISRVCACVRYHDMGGLLGQQHGVSRVCVTAIGAVDGLKWLPSPPGNPGTL